MTRASHAPSKRDSTRVSLLELGADDYLVKPFGFRELVARIGAVTRRTIGGGSPAVTGVQTVGPMRIDRDARGVQ